MFTYLNCLMMKQKRSQLAKKPGEDESQEAYDELDTYFYCQWHKKTCMDGHNSLNLENVFSRNSGSCDAGIVNLVHHA